MQASQTAFSSAMFQSLAQLAFNHDMIKQVVIENDQKQVLQKKEHCMLKNNALENEKYSDYQCCVGDFIKIMCEKNSMIRPTKLSKPNEAPHQIVEVNDNTTKIQSRDFIEGILFTRIAPYFEKNAESV